MAEPTDYVIGHNFTEATGTSVADIAGTDDLTIAGTGGQWVTTAYPGLAAVGYQFSRAGDGRAQTTITGSDLFGTSKEYTTAVLALVDPGDRVRSALVAPTTGTSRFNMSGHIVPWDDGRVWAGHVDIGAYEEVAAAKSDMISDGSVPHWVAVTCTDIGGGAVQLRLWSWPIGGTPVLRAVGVKDATSDGNNIDRWTVANIADGGQALGADVTVFVDRGWDRALSLAELGELGTTATDADPVCVTDGNQTVNVGAVVTVDLTGSSDVETAFADLAFSVAVLDADGTGIVAGDIDVTTDHGYATFVAPAVASNGIDLRFTVTDSALNTDFADVTVIVQALPAVVFPAAPLDYEAHLLLGGSWTDVSAYLDADAPVTVGVGRQDWSSQSVSSRCTLTLLDDQPPTGRWSSRNPTGPYYGLLGRNTPVRVKLTRAGEYWRFHGFVGSWPQRWDPTGTDNRVPIEASGILSRLEQWTDALQSVLRRNIPLLPDLVGYWPLEDTAAPNRRRLASGIEGGAQMRVIGSARPDYASYDGFDASAAILTLNDAEIRGDVNFYSFISGKANLQFGFPLRVGASGSTSGQTLVHLNTSAVADQWEVRYTTTSNGSLELHAKDTTETEILNSGTLKTGVNGSDLLVVVQLARSKNETAIDWDVHVFAPGGDPEGDSYSGRVSTTSGLGRAERVVINAGGGHTDVAVGHVFVQSQISSPTELVAALAAHAGERAGRRIERLCDQAGVPFVAVGDLDDTERMGPQRVGSFLELVRQCVDADGGILFEPTDQLALGYRTRRSLENQAAQVAFDYTDVVLADLEHEEDFADIANDVTARSQDGTEARVTVEDGPLNVNPPTDTTNPGVGRYEVTIDRNVDAGRLASHASWWAHLGTVDESRFPRVAVSMSNRNVVSDGALTHAILAAGVGDRLTVGNGPAWLGPDLVTQLIQGYEETLSPFKHELSFLCSPESPYQLPDLDDSTWRFASAGSATTADFVAGTGTSMTVATTRGPLWTLKSASWPFNVRAAGSVLSVTAVGSGFEDTFARTVSSGWGTADGGWAWTNEGGTASDYNVGSGVGTVEDDEAGSATRRVLIPAAFVADNIGPDVEALWSVSIPEVSTGNAAQASMIVREDGSNNNFYVFRIIFGLSSNIQVRISIRQGGVETTLVDAPGSQATYSAGTVIHVRNRIVGDRLDMKAWAGSDPEPDWQAWAQDSTFPDAGRIGLRSSADTGWAGTLPLVFTWSQFEIVNPQKLTVSTTVVNGVTKTIPAGSPVQVDPVPRLRL